MMPLQGNRNSRRDIVSANRNNRRDIMSGNMTIADRTFISGNRTIDGRTYSQELGLQPTGHIRQRRGLEQAGNRTVADWTNMSENRTNADGHYVREQDCSRYEGLICRDRTIADRSLCHGIGLQLKGHIFQGIGLSDVIMWREYDYTGRTYL